MMAQAAVEDLVAAALAPPGPERSDSVAAALAGTDPDRLGFGGWRALLLLDDALGVVSNPVWARRTASLRRRSFAAAAMAVHHGTALSGALTAAGIDHVITGELALACRYPRPGDRPVHGLTIVANRSRRHVGRVLSSSGVPVQRFGRRSLRADLGGLTLLVHHGWPGAPDEAIVIDPDPPARPDGSPALALATPDAEARRIRRPPADPDAPADRIDLAALASDRSRP